MKNTKHNKITIEWTEEEYERLQAILKQPRKKQVPIRDKTPSQSLIATRYYGKRLLNQQPKNTWLFDATNLYTKIARVNNGYHYARFRIR